MRAIMVRPNPIWMVSQEDEEMRTYERCQGCSGIPREHTERRRPSANQGEGYRGSQLCWHLDLGPLVSETVRINFCCLIHPVCGILSWKPYQPKTDVQYGRVEKGLWPWFTRIRIMCRGGGPLCQLWEKNSCLFPSVLVFLYIIQVPIKNSTRLIFCSVSREGKSGGSHCGSKQGFLNEEGLCLNLNYTILSKLCNQSCELI